MPILACEPDVFPENLLDSEGGADVGGQWWLLYTMSRREKNLMRRLHAAEIPFYAPLVKQRKRSPAGRMRNVCAAVPRLCLFAWRRCAAAPALATNCVSRCLSVADAGKLVDDLRQIRRLIDADAPLMPESSLEPGRRIRVC